MAMKRLLYFIMLLPLWCFAQSDPAPTGATVKPVTSYFNIVGSDSSSYIFQNGKFYQVVGRKWLFGHYAQLSGGNTFTGNQYVQSGLLGVAYGVPVAFENQTNTAYTGLVSAPGSFGNHVLLVPQKSGTLARLEDIDSLSSHYYFGSGLTSVNDTVTLGGTLTQDANITGNGHAFIVNSDDGFINNYFNNYGGIGLGSARDDNSLSGFITILTDRVITQVNQSDSSTSININGSGSDIRVIDQLFHKGFVYDSHYNFTDPGAIVDKQYVDSLSFRTDSGSYAAAIAHADSLNSSVFNNPHSFNQSIGFNAGITLSNKTIGSNAHVLFEDDNNNGVGTLAFYYSGGVLQAYLPFTHYAATIFNSGATFNNTPPVFNNSFNFNNGNDFTNLTDDNVLVFSPGAGNRAGYVARSTFAKTSDLSGYIPTGGAVTSFSKTDGFGVVSTVTNPTTTPNHSIRVDTTAVQTVSNVFPRTDTRYYTKGQSDGNLSAGLATKQASGNYITSITGDATASGPGSAAITLATVNSNVGTFNNVTINGKGLVTSASNISYQAPLTFDTTPTNGSTNPVTSGGIYTAIAAVPTYSAANPTTQIGLSIVNGTATTYMRSDAAPSLDVTITPNWTGAQHTFQGKIGINTLVPTNSLTFGTGSTGIAVYNTTDQVTNYEKATFGWASNIYSISTLNGGTGVGRNLALSGSGTNFTLGITNGLTANSTAYLNRIGSSVANLLELAFAPAQGSTGSQSTLLVSSTINQSGTAGYRGIWIAPYEQTVGSGSKYLIDAGVSTGVGTSGYTSKFTVDNTGLVYSNNGFTTSSRVSIGATTQGSAQLYMTGGITTGATFGTAGFGIQQTAATYSSTSTTTTASNAYINSYGAATLTSTTAIAIGKAYGNYFNAPIAGANMSITAAYAAGFAGPVEFAGNIVPSAAFTYNLGSASVPFSATNANKTVLYGSTSGVVSIVPQTSAGTYNFNLPTSAGGIGQVLLSGGGVNNPMTWGTDPLVTPALVSFSGTTQTLVFSTDYVFTGSSASTATCPAPTSSNTGRGYQITIKNAGSATLTVNGAIYDGSAVTTISLSPGSSCTLMPGTTSFYKE